MTESSLNSNSSSPLSSAELNPVSDARDTNPTPILQPQKRFIPLTLRHNFSWNIMGNFLYTLCQWGMVVVLAKLGGNAEMVGQFTLGLAVVAPVMLFTGMQLRAVQSTDARGEFQLGDYLSLRLLGIATAFLVILAIVVLTPYPPATKGVILVLAVAKALESLSEILHGYFQLSERMDRIARSLIIKGPLSLLLMTLGVWLTGQVLGGVCGLVLAWGLVLCFHDLRVARTLQKFSASPLGQAHTQLMTRIQPTWRWPILWRLLLLSLPLGFVMFLISLNVNIPRYFIEHYLGDQELGIFAGIAYIPLAGDLVINALAQSASPRLAHHYATGHRGQFLKLFLKLLGVGAVVGIVGLILARHFGAMILTAFYRPEFSQHTDVFELLLIASSLGYLCSICGYALTAVRQFWAQAPTFLFVTSTSAFLCHLLIPTQGLHGAVTALITAATIQLVINAGILTYALLKKS